MKIKSIIFRNKFLLFAVLAVFVAKIVL